MQQQVEPSSLVEYPEDPPRKGGPEPFMPRRRGGTIQSPPRSFPPDGYRGPTYEHVLGGNPLDDVKWQEQDGPYVYRPPVQREPIGKYEDMHIPLEHAELEKDIIPAVMVGERRMVVGICGFKAHGKDTAAQVLTQKFGFTRLAFADGVKKVVAEILHIPLWWLHDPSRKEEMHEPSGKTYRQWMQLMGTEVGRNIWGDAWINWWKGEVEALDLQRVVVTDMRFWNEFNMITEGEWDALTLRVRDPRKADAADMHESERYALMFPVNAEVVNGGTIPELWDAAESKALKRFPQLWVN